MSKMKIDDVKIKINPFTWVFILLLVLAGLYIELIDIILTVAIHEVSHYLVAKKLNINMIQIEIFPFGGAAVFDSEIFIRPDLEIIIALAGPLSNAVFIMILIIVSQIIGTQLDYLIRINVLMCAFNLLPGVPLDGGRALKSVLSNFIGLTRANNIAVKISYAISLLLVYGSILTFVNGNKNYVLITMAVFLIISARNERRLSQYFNLRDLIYKKEELFKRGIMNVRTVAVLENQKLIKIINCFLPLKYHIIVVLDKNLKEKKRLTETELFDFAIENGLYLPIGEILSKIK
ncbi:peptidase M50 [Thermoanaerobacterium aotearoense SCUT27]|uniref:Peptidase M50 n=3 Tax=Thermoanaerobacterium TaxID=28895 RepID=W9EA76_9THEO|nr:peptidase M50 [Thermoanaerobacterium saccharolyticum JW/SL-YS485]ETO38898.1 peptidase M50 [Thermoanaerobacterium aotearoense SCUT27]